VSSGRPGPARRLLARVCRSVAPGARAAPGAPDVPTGLLIEYSPSLDGDADPGEVVWTWVPYEDDASQGKDRPVMVIGRRGRRLVAVALTSKQHDTEAQVLVGSGAWDRAGRPSYAKVERLLDIDASAVRREGAIVGRAQFDAVVAGARRAHGGTLR
jgi:rhodanese-related sulfurtransferase